MLTITAPTTPAKESAGKVNFVITTTTNLGSNFRVRYDPSEVGSGNFLNESATPTSQEVATSTNIDFLGTSNYYTAILPIPIHDDGVGERTGQIEVSLLEDDVIEKTYKIVTDGSQTVRATVLDDDAPELKISAGEPVTEGDGNTANFTVTTEISVSSLRVFYTQWVRILWKVVQGSQLLIL